jgi:hypothetical protein
VIALECAAALNCVLACMSVNNRRVLECNRGVEACLKDSMHACITAKDCWLSWKDSCKHKQRRIRLVNNA